MLSKTEIKKLRKWMPDGFIRLIAEKTKFSESLVQKFFSGAKYNKLIHECALEIAENRKNEFNELVERNKGL